MRKHAIGRLIGNLLWTVNNIQSTVSITQFVSNRAIDAFMTEIGIYNRNTLKHIHQHIHI